MTRSFPTRRSSDRKACAAVPPFAWLYRQPDISAFLRPRPGNAHKGLFGHVLCIGGERGMAGAITLCAHGALRAGRSEEHTSELQSLMRISYAVFCLKKKKSNTNTETDPHLK